MSEDCNPKPLIAQQTTGGFSIDNKVILYVLIGSVIILVLIIGVWLSYRSSPTPRPPPMPPHNMRPHTPLYTPMMPQHPPGQVANMPPAMPPGQVPMPPQNLAGNPLPNTTAPPAQNTAPMAPTGTATTAPAATGNSVPPTQPISEDVKPDKEEIKKFINSRPEEPVSSMDEIEEV